MQVYQQTEGKGLYLSADIGRWVISSEPGSYPYKLRSCRTTACPGDATAGWTLQAAGWNWKDASGNYVYDETVSGMCVCIVYVLEMCML